MATPAHRSSTSGGRGRWGPLRVVAVVAAAGVVATGGAVAATQLSGGGPSRAVTGTRAGGSSGRLTGTRSHSSLGSHSSRKSGASPTTTASSTTTTTQPPPPLKVRSVSPSSGASGVATDQRLTITFSHGLSAHFPQPTITPNVLGHWRRAGRSLVFTPTAGYLPDTTVTVSVPATTAAVEGGHTVGLGHAFQTSFTAGTGSVLRLQQLLAQLGYLPVRFVPAGAGGTAGLQQEPKQADQVSTNPVAGRWEWKWGNIPAALSAAWAPGQNNLVTKGAVMAFEGDHGMAPSGWVDGIPGPQVWTALVKAVAARQTDPRPYNYIEVNEEGTEYLRVWQDGRIVFQALTNTGVAGAATAKGTFPVASHLPSNWMTGRDVNGTHYHVQVYFAAYFNGGDAVHAYPRASYGWPQSNGCVELSYADAQHLYNDGEDWYGTLVTVS